MSNQNHTLLLEDDFAHLVADAIASARPFIQGDKKLFFAVCGRWAPTWGSLDYQTAIAAVTKTFRARQRPLILGLSRLKRLLP